MNEPSSYIFAINEFQSFETKHGINSTAWITDAIIIPDKILGVTVNFCIFKPGFDDDPVM